MQTGLISSYGEKIVDIGPMYPFVGWEVPMVIVAFVLWIVWHIKQIKIENEEIQNIQKLVKDKEIQALHISRTNSGKR